MAQGHCPEKFPLHTPARKSVVRSYPASPAAEPTKGVVTPESSPVKSRLEGYRCIPFVLLLIKLVRRVTTPKYYGRKSVFFSTYTSFDK